jgi:hypothetical protein
MTDTVINLKSVEPKNFVYKDLKNCQVFKHKEASENYYYKTSSGYICLNNGIVYPEGSDFTPVEVFTAEINLTRKLN